MGTYLRANQVAEIESDRAVLKQKLDNPHIQDKALVANQLSRLEKQLVNQTPPDTTPEERDKLAKREKELAGRISGDMMSDEEMRKCPAGAIGRELKFQRERKPDVLEWKNIRRRLEKSGSPSVTEPGRAP